MDNINNYQWHNKNNNLDGKWIELLGAEHYKVCNLNNLARTITDIVTSTSSAVVTTNEGIGW